MADVEQTGAEPTGSPPSYSEVISNDAAKLSCEQDDCGQRDPKEPQYTWADPMPNQCAQAAASAPYPPPPPAGPVPYGPPYGQPTLAYYQQQAGYGTATYYSVATAGHQRAQVMMVAGGQPQQQPGVVIEHVQSFVGHIVLACIVTFCCNCVLGFVAFVLASKHADALTLLSMGTRKHRNIVNTSVIFNGPFTN